MFYLAYLFVSYVENTVLKNSKILSSESRFAIFWLPFTKGLSKLIPLVPKGPTEQGQQPAVTQSESSCRLPVTSSGDVTSEVNHVPKIDILEWSIKMTGQENFELFYHQLFCYRGVVSLRQPVRALLLYETPQPSFTLSFDAFTHDVWFHPSLSTGCAWIGYLGQQSWLVETAGWPLLCSVHYCRGQCPASSMVVCTAVPNCLLGPS